VPNSNFDPNAILAALGVDDVSAVAPISSLWTAIWRVERGDSVYALRVLGPGETAACQRECIAMQAAAAAGVPVPKIHATGTWQDRPALLLSWCPGRPLLDELQYRPWRFWTLAVAYGRIQAVINAISAPPNWKPHPVTWIDWAGPQEELLRSRLLALDLQDPVLLHLDYHPLNILAARGRITCVVDWAFTRVGDPRADFALTYTYLRVVPPPPSNLPTRIVRLARWLLERGWRYGYQQEAGHMDNMALFYAWAGVVVAHNLAPSVGQPGSWLQEHHIESIRQWTVAWKRRAGLV
jgi:aminoglycoside phosphotransferase (APT) family kinase protein